MDKHYQLYIEHNDDAYTVKHSADSILIGSSDECEVKLMGSEVLAKHARMFHDPFGRLVIEIAHSDADIYVNGKKGEAFSVRPGDRIGIGSFLLRIIREVEKSILPPPRWQDGAIFEDDEPTITHERESRPDFTTTGFENLDKITNSLAAVTDVRDLYPEACKHLGRMHNTIALVVKVPKADTPLVQGTKIIAHSRASDHHDSTPPPSIHLSRTVLEAVRTQKTALSASAEAGNDNVRLSFIDDLAPRMVLAAPIAETKTGIDVLYVDQPAYIARPDALSFFAIVARMVNLTRQTLSTAEERADRKLLDHQIDTAKQIQSNLTPKKLDWFDNVELALHYKPALWVGGDYCDLRVSSDNRLVFAVGDVSGKGLPAAMVMANLQAMLRSILLFSSNPQIILGKINEMLSDTLLDAMFITMLLGFFDPETGELEYVNAGHELPILVSPFGTVRQLGEPVNSPLGIEKGAYKVQRYKMSRGEGLLSVSDGITDTMSPSSEMFGTKNLMNTVEKSFGRSCRGIVDSVVAATHDFRGRLPQGDDTTVLALKWK